MSSFSDLNSDTGETVTSTPCLPHPWDERRKERWWRAAVLFLVLVGAILPLEILQAGPVKDLINLIQLGIATVLGWIITFLGYLIIMIVSVVVDVAQFNDFVRAKPVQSGWPLVRDVTNMFFIVVLLITAFSTIVQWSKFNYRQILPKLLLMAVLVNFSLTIIGLLIDFSQVIMLTFVNGFKAAAGGNFVTALKLDKIMKLAQSNALQTPEDVGAVNKDNLLTQLLLAELLGIFFLTITITMLIIMLMFLIVRIVGLWILLILSPLAFFATALQTTPLSAYVGAVGAQYWQRLGSLLSGGPVMAFFLWLTLATVQGGGFGTFAKPGGGEREVAQVTTYFASAISNVEDVATFFVAIIMLLTGVQIAIQTGSQVSGAFGAAAGRVQQFGMGAARMLTYGGAAVGAAYAGRGAARLAQRVAERPAAAIAERLQGAALARGYTGLATGLGVIAQAPRRRVTRRMEELERAGANLSTGSRMRALERAATKRGTTGRAAKENLAKLQMSPAGRKEMEAFGLVEAEKRGLKGTNAKAYAERDVRKKQGSALETRAKLAEESRNEDEIKKVHEEKQKMPHLIGDKDKRRELLESMMNDMTPPEMSKHISMSAYQDGEFADQLMEVTGMLQPDGEFNKDNPFYKSMVAAGGVRGDILKRRQGGERGQAGLYVKETEGPNRGQYNLQSDAALAGLETAGLPAAKEIRARREAEIASGKSKMKREREGADGEAVRKTQLGMMSAGADLTETYNVTNDGQFTDRGDVNNYAVNVKATHAAAKQDVKIYKQLDTKTLQNNAKRFNEARSEFVKNTSVNDLRNAHQAAQATGDKETIQGVSNMIRTMDMEGSRAESMIDEYNKAQGKKKDTEGAGGLGVVKSQIMEAARQANTDMKKGSDALNSALEGSDLSGKFTIEDAQAMMKHQEMKSDEMLRNYTQSVSERAKEAIGAASRGAAQAAGGAVAAGGRAARQTFTAGGRTERRIERGERRMDERGERPPTIEPPRPPTPPTTPTA